MKRSHHYHQVNHKKGISVETNLQQVVAIIVIFFAMFVLPIQAYNIYKESQKPQTATYTAQSPVSSEKTDAVGQVLGAVDSAIPEGLKEADKQTFNIIIFVGTIGLALAGIALISVVLKR